MIPRGPSTVPPQVVAILRGLIEERIGLSYDSVDASVLVEKLWARAEAAGFESLLDYYYFLRYDPASGVEFQALTDALVVSESYFFREYDQLQVAVEDFIAPLAETGRRVRVWSAACAAGEEPASLAIMLERRGLLSQVEIVASDVSERALSRARNGEYGARALRAVPEPEQPPRWIRVVDGRPTLDPQIRAAIRFVKLNLMDTAAVAALGEFDVVFCRNVLIYFDDERVQQTVDLLTRALRPGGALFVGVSESLLRFRTQLGCEEHRGVFAYRKAP